MASKKGARRVEWGLSTGRVGGCWHGVGREQGQVGNSRAEWMVGWKEEGRNAGVIRTEENGLVILQTARWGSNQQAMTFVSNSIPPSPKNPLWGFAATPKPIFYAIIMYTPLLCMVMFLFVHSLVINYVSSYVMWTLQGLFMYNYGFV